MTTRPAFLASLTIGAAVHFVRDMGADETAEDATVLSIGRATIKIALASGRTEEVDRWAGYVRRSANRRIEPFTGPAADRNAAHRVIVDAHRQQLRDRAADRVTVAANGPW
jgi:hypothetical protein